MVSVNILDSRLGHQTGHAADFQSGPVAKPSVGRDYWLNNEQFIFRIAQADPEYKGARHPVRVAGNRCNTGSPSGARGRFRLASSR